MEKNQDYLDLLRKISKQPNVSQRMLAEELGFEKQGHKGKMMKRHMGKGKEFKDVNGDGVCDKADLPQEENQA